MNPSPAHVGRACDLGKEFTWQMNSQKDSKQEHNKENNTS